MNSKQRDYSLDFLKIIATICIVFHHYQQLTGAYFENGINFFNGKFYFGYIVELFFLLSGYFMYSYIEKIQKGLTFPKFYFKRFSRLFPLLAIGAISEEILLYIYEKVYQSLWHEHTPDFWGAVITSLGIQEGWALPNPHINNPTWYISVLLLCYVVFFLIVFISNKINVCPQYLFIFMVFLGMGISTYSINIPFINMSVYRGYYSFFFGVLFAGVINRKVINNKINWISFVIVIMIPLLIRHTPRFINSGINYIMTFIYYPVLIILIKIKPIEKMLNKKIIGKLGQISFDVFIWHAPFFILLDILIKVFKLNINLNTHLSMIMYVIVCYIWGTISHFFIEIPLRNFIDKRLIREEL